MTDAELRAIRARCDKAPPGPWHRDGFHVFHGDDFPLLAAIEHGQADMNWSLRALDFITHAREDVPALLAEVERLRAELAAIRALPLTPPGKGATT